MRGEREEGGGGTYGLRNQKCGEDTREHEGAENLHDVVEPW